MKSVKIDQKNPVWYLGLDIGTNSVGFCATNSQYDILTKGGKLQCGSRLFDEAHDASERRAFRSKRRRQARKQRRIDLLQDLFATQISDKFFLSLNESRLYQQDRTDKLKFTLFNDSNFTDKDYFNKFPTAYHLRKYLQEHAVQDIRLVYLACHHILKSRGHFLFEEFNPEKSDGNFEDIIRNINVCLEKLFDDVVSPLFYEDFDNRFTEIRKNCSGADLWDKLASIMNVEGKQKKVFDIIKGNKIDLKFLCPEKFENIDEQFDIDLKKFKFKDPQFDEILAKLIDNDILSDDNISLINYCKSFYDRVNLEIVLNGSSTISEALVKRYDQHKEDLMVFKRFIRNYMPDAYDLVFRETSDSSKDATYSHYIGSSISSCKKNISHSKICINANKKQFGHYAQTATKEEFIKFVGELIKKSSDEAKRSDDYKYIIKKLEDETFCEKSRIKDNACFPNQLSTFELKLILERQKSSFPEFLTDENIDKIIKLNEFRIPYYVGPLSDLHSDKNGFAWIKRTNPHSHECITPWNFEKEVDLFASGEEFIARMISRCTYLPDQKVLPAQSLLYQEYLLLNDLNNLKINGERITQDLKDFLYTNLCQKEERITKAKIRKELLNAKKISENDILGQSDKLEIEFQSSLSSMIKCKKILDIGDNQRLTTQQREMCERIISWLTVFGEEKNPVKERITKEYGKELTPTQIKQFLQLDCSKWGRLSSKLLSGIFTSYRHQPFMQLSIIDALRESTMNFMEILNCDDFSPSFLSAISKDKVDDNDDIAYQDVADLYCSPAVKRSIWQAFLITKELTKINSNIPPSKVFLEVTRSEDISKKKKLQSTRRTMIKNLLKDLDKENAYLCEKMSQELSSVTDDQLRGDRIYLYFIQLGKCMYSGESIDLGSLLSGNSPYDIDHIYPQSLVLDDSISNRVLVKRVENAKKSDKYPLSDDIRNKMGSYWTMLEKKKLIDGTKYQRLISSRPLTQDQIDGFCNRQLVNTSQAVKSIGELLQRYFSKSKSIKTKIVYSRAEIVSKFRKGFKIYKSRIVNDLHHAHDAYLNIVVGNVWYNLFTKPFGAGLNDNPYARLMRNEIEESNPRTYEDKKFSSVMRIFCKCKSEFWSIDYLDKVKSYTVRSSEKYVNKFPVSIMPHEYVGAFYDQTTHIKSEGDNAIQLKNGLDPKKYGCYKSAYVAYIMVIEYKDFKTSKVERAFCQVPALISKMRGIIDDDKWLMKICNYNGINISSKDDVRIVYNKLLFDHLLEIDHSRYLVKQGDLSCISDCQWYPSDHILEIVKNFEKFQSRLLECKTDEDKGKLEYAKFSLEDSKLLFIAIIEQLKKSFYVFYPYTSQISQDKYLFEKFDNLSLFQRTELISQLFKFINNSGTMADMRLLGGVQFSICFWKNPVSKIFKSKMNVNLVTQSVTGLFEKKFSLT